MLNSTKAQKKKRPAFASMPTCTRERERGGIEEGKRRKTSDG
jgi:hypothetical protein